jgi:NTP pyrophosphatase (non-canonical NTP hydrolase)
MTFYKEIFDKCKLKWGLDSQILMLAEECSELSVACLHLLRNLKQEGAREHLAEEIADVEIMIEEVTYYLQLNTLVQMKQGEKLKRLQQILNNP